MGCVMHVGFDISQTGSQKAGCGYYADALIKAMIAVAPQNQYSLFPSFGDFFLDAEMPLINPYDGAQLHYGPRHINREFARNFWDDGGLESAIGRPDVLHCNNFWVPIQVKSSRIIYTLYDLGFTTDADWTTEENRVGCFEGVFRSSIVADWVVAISEHCGNTIWRFFLIFRMIAYASSSMLLALRTQPARGHRLLR